MNENPEGTPNPLNPAPGTENDMAAGTGLDFVETEQVSEVMAESETPVSPEVPEKPEAPEVAELGEIKEASIDVEPVKPASFAEAANESKPEPVSVNTNPIDPMMKPVSHNNFDSFAADDTIMPEAPAEEIKEETFVRSEMPVTTPVSNTPDLVAKDSIVEPANGGSKKRVLIIGAIILVLIAIICGAAAAAFMLVGNSDDRVTKAIDKLLNGEISTIVSAKGNISAADDAAETTTNINFDGTFDLRSSMNKVSATVDVDLLGGTNISLGFDELSNKDGDTYFKVSGLTDMVKVNADADTTDDAADEESSTASNCVGDASGTTNCATPPVVPSAPNSILSIYSRLLSVADNEWVLISGDFGEQMGSLDLFDNNSTCLINAFSTMPKYSKDIANKYKANPFITYSTDKLGITKKQNNLYRLGFDENKLTAFVNSLSSNGFINELNACAGDAATNSEISVEAIKNIFNGFPTVYVEIDDQYNFTRVYFQTTVETGNTCEDCVYVEEDEDEEDIVEAESSSTIITADLSLSYPSDFSIEEPDEYIELSTLLSKVFTQLFSNGSTI